jgi:hypothetical protein
MVSQRGSWGCPFSPGHGISWGPRICVGASRNPTFPCKAGVTRWRHRGTDRRKRALPNVAIAPNIAGGVPEVQNRLPMRLNEYTTLTAVRVGYTDRTYQYAITIRGSDADFAALERQIRTGACASDMRSMISEGILYRYEYRDASNAVVRHFEISSCP